MRSSTYSLVAICLLTLVLIVNAAPTLQGMFHKAQSENVAPPEIDLDQAKQLLARDGAIRLELGTGKVNVGGLTSGSLYTEVYKAIERACLSSDNTKCDQTQAKFTVWEEGNGERVRGDLYVQVNWADWKGSNQVYNLLRGALAGSIERGAVNINGEKNCRYFKAPKQGADWWHCNTVNFAGIYLPNGANMGISLSSKRGGGDMDCGMAKETITSGLDSLRGEIESIVGGNTFYDSVCCYGPREKCRDYPAVRGQPGLTANVTMEGRFDRESW